MKDSIRVRIEVDLSDEFIAEAIFKSIKPEAKIRLRGVRTEVSLIDSKIIIFIKAPDYSSLRATTNAFLRLIDTAVKVLRSVQVANSNLNNLVLN